MKKREEGRRRGIMIGQTHKRDGKAITENGGEEMKI